MTLIDSNRKRVLSQTWAYTARDMSVKIKAILLDLKFPKIDGSKVLGRLHDDERTKLLPVVVLFIKGGTGFN